MGAFRGLCMTAIVHLKQAMRCPPEVRISPSRGTLLCLKVNARRGSIKSIGLFAPNLQTMLDRYRDTLELMVTIHSFTPVYRGQNRSVELGLLHGEDDRFALKMLENTPSDLPLVTRLNEPYSALDGVAHTLDCHAAPRGLLNVMIEIRNDLVETPEQQQAIANDLVPWIDKTLSVIRGEDVVQ